MGFPKPNLKEFIGNSGKYLALIKHPNDNGSSYFTLFVVEDREKAENEIKEVLNDLGECTTATWNRDEIDYLIKNEGWYRLTDYTGGVIECK